MVIGKSECSQWTPAQQVDQLWTLWIQQFLHKKVKAHFSRTHGERYACTICQSEYDLEAFKAHMRMIHGEKKLPCQSCDFVTNSPSQLNNHFQRVHTVNKCNKCDHISANLGCLKIHQKNKHEGERFKCPQCDYQATQKGNLAIHRESVHDGVIHQCDLCDYKSSTRRSIILHKKSRHVAVAWNFIFSPVK